MPKTGLGQAEGSTPDQSCEETQSARQETELAAGPARLGRRRSCKLLEKFNLVHLRLYKMTGTTLAYAIGRFPPNSSGSTRKIGVAL